MPAARPRRLGSRSAATRSAILEAAIAEFGAHGFDGASMHRIARRADVHTPQLSYHFGDKRGLWEAAVASLLEELDAQIAAAADPSDPEAALRAFIRAFVRFAADRPELNRIVVSESASGSDRLPWLVETHTLPRFRALTALVEPLRRAGIVKKIPATSLYYIVVGGASLPFVASAEAAQLAGCEPSDPDFVEAHTAALEALIFQGA